jgi:signal transduction histidine kinase
VRNLALEPGPAGSAGSQFRALLEDRGGRLWAASAESGLFVFQGGQERRITTRDGLSANEVVSLFEDSGGAIWAGTQYDGLNRIDGSSIRAFSRASGFEAGVYQILEDDTGHLWLGTAVGIYRVNRQALEEHLLRGAAAPPLLVFGAADGMPSAECSSGQQPGAWKARDGRLWFSTIHGAVAIDPRAMPENRPGPPVALEEMIVNGRKVRMHDSLRLAPGSNALEIHFTALSLRDAANTVFRYRLAGQGQGWTVSGARRTAYFTNLKPGQYTFEAAARAGGLQWSEPPARISFTIRPHFYQTASFYLICAIGAAMAGWAAYRSRLARLEARFDAVLGERNRIAREIHDTLMQGVAGISAHLEALSVLLEADPAKAATRLDRLRELTRGVVADARRRIWDLRTPDLEQGTLADALQTAAQRATAESRVRFDLTVEGTERRLPGSVEECLLHIAREAVANAVLHSGGDRIRMRLSYGRADVKLAVSDNGHGIGQGAVERPGHFGIVGMRERAAGAGGRLEIEGGEGGGTVVRAEVPLP